LIEHAREAIKPQPQQGMDSIDPEQAGDKALLNSIYVKVQMMDSIYEELKDMKKSMQFLSDKYDTAIKELDGCKKQVQKLNNENQYLHHELNKVQLALNEVEQYSRRKNIEIHGVDQNNEENVMEVVKKLAKKINVPFNEEMVQEAYRMKPPKKNRNNRPPVIFARFNNKYVAETWLKKTKTNIKCIEIVPQGSENKIYINENLTKRTRDLYFQARIRGKELRFKYVWTKFGKIFMKKDDDDRAICILNYDDLPIPRAFESSMNDSTFIDSSIQQEANA